MWWWLYIFPIHQAKLILGSIWVRCGVDVGLMRDRSEVDVFVVGKIYRININIYIINEVEVEGGNNKIVEAEANNKNCEAGR